MAMMMSEVSMDDAPQSGASVALVFAFTCFWADSCLICLGLNFIPGLVTMLSLACLIVVCRIVVPANHSEEDEEQPANLPRKQVWASVNLASLNASPPDFHLVQFHRPAGSSEQLMKTVLWQVSVPSAKAPCEQLTCSCCMDDFRPTDPLALLPCGHVFHEECVMKWFLTDASAGACTMCRARVLHHVSQAAKQPGLHEKNVSSNVHASNAGTWRSGRT